MVRVFATLFCMICAFSAYAAPQEKWRTFEITPRISVEMPEMTIEQTHWRPAVLDGITYGQQHVVEYLQQNDTYLIYVETTVIPRVIYYTRSPGSHLQRAAKKVIEQMDVQWKKKRMITLATTHMITASSIELPHAAHVQAVIDVRERRIITMFYDGVYNPKISERFLKSLVIRPVTPSH